MLRIILLKSPGNLNIGNEFINVGSEYLVRKALDKSGVKEYKLSCLEFWETTLPLYKNRTDWNTKEMRAWINEADLILIAGGAIVSKHLRDFLKDVGGMKPSKILLGAGMLLYDEQERKIAKEVLLNYDLVVCRDNLLHEVIKDIVPSHSGIDLAFFINDTFSLSGVKGKYAVVNIDLNLRQMWQLKRKYKELKEKFSIVYITDNTSTLHKNIKGFVFLSRWSEFCNLYGNAAFVSTTRVHTAVLCTVFGTSFEYLGGDKTKRSSLFDQIGMSLEKGKEHSSQELERYAETIRQKKKEMLNQLAVAMKNILQG